MFVSDLRHFVDIPDDAPGPARKMAEHLGLVVRAATAGGAGEWWVTALTCRRRPGNKPCPGHIGVFRADLPAPIEWQCSVCGDRGTISAWEDSPFDLRRPRVPSKHEPTHAVVLTNEQAAALRDVTLLDTDCERLVFQMHGSSDAIILSSDADELEELVGFIAAEANHEINRRRRKRLDEVFAVLNDVLRSMETDDGSSNGVKQARNAPTRRPQRQRETSDVTGRWKIVEMDLWDDAALHLVGPAFIEFKSDRTGSFGFIAVSGWIDWRCEPKGSSRVEFSWEGTDEGDPVSGRGWATLQGGNCLGGHLYFHLGDDSGFHAERLVQ